MRGLIRWSQRPQRLTLAGIVSCWSQIFVLVWTWAYFAASWSAGILEGIFWKTAVECTILSLAFAGPLSLLSWLVYRGRQWPFWPALAMLVAQFAGELYGAFDDGVVLAGFYPNIYAKLASYTMLILASVIQLALYALAIPAWYRRRHALLESCIRKF